jgi:hypothetical protein
LEFREPTLFGKFTYAPVPPGKYTLPSPANGPKLEYATVLATVAVFDTTYAGILSPEDEKSCGTNTPALAIPVSDAVCAP